MGPFGRTKTIRNAAGVEIAAPPPARPIVTPGNTTIHNHGVSWPAIIAVAFLCALLLLPVGWFALVFLFDKMGARDAESEAAFWVVFIPVFILAGWLLKWLLLAVIDCWRGWDLEIEQERSQQARDNLLSAQTALDPGRMNESDFEFARVILAVMMIAYDWLAQHGGGPFRGAWRPWSMRSAKEAAAGIGVKLTDTQANGVSLWLHDKGVIDSPAGGQITKTYPDLSNVRLLLEKEYGKPIVVVSPALRNT